MESMNRMGLLGDAPMLDVQGKTNREILRHVLGASANSDIETLAGRKAGESFTDRVFINLKWLGLFSDEPFLATASPISPLDFLLQLMIRKMQYATGERDMIVLCHDFVVAYGNRRERITARLKEVGDPVPEGYMAMAKTVGLPAAVAADLYLQGKIQLSGVQIPIVSEIYEPVLQKLIEFGFAYEEKTESLANT